MKKWLAPAALLALLAAVGFILLAPQSKPAPAFTLQNLERQTVTQEHLRGKVSLINFWFPSCPGCVSEMPKLIQMAHDHQGKNFQIIAISLGKPDPLSAVEAYAQQYRLSFTVLYDAQGRVEQAYGIKAAPTSFLIDRHGNIVKTYVGEPESFPELYREVEKLLAE